MITLLLAELSHVFQKRRGRRDTLSIVHSMKRKIFLKHRAHMHTQGGSYEKQEHWHTDIGIISISTAVLHRR